MRCESGAAGSPPGPVSPRSARADGAPLGGARWAASAGAAAGKSRITSSAMARAPSSLKWVASSGRLASSRLRVFPSSWLRTALLALRSTRPTFLGGDRLHRLGVGEEGVRQLPSPEGPADHRRHEDGRPAGRARLVDVAAEEIAEGRGRIGRLRMARAVRVIVAELDDDDVGLLLQRRGPEALADEAPRAAAGLREVADAHVVREVILQEVAPAEARIGGGVLAHRRVADEDHPEGRGRRVRAGRRGGEQRERAEGKAPDQVGFHGHKLVRLAIIAGKGEPQPGGARITSGIGC